MENETLTPEQEREWEARLGAPEVRAEFREALRSRLQTRFQEAGFAPSTPVASAPRTRRLAWSLSLAALTVTAAGVLIAGPANVASALREALGYIPGFGVVRTDSLRVLAEPVSATRDGFTVTITRLIADSAATSLSYSVTWEIAPEGADDPEAKGVCQSTPALRMPDGSLLASYAGGGIGRPDGYDEGGQYPPLPAGVMDVTFVLACINGAKTGAAPEDWSIPLHLVPGTAPSVVPVVDIPTPAPGAAPTATSVSALATTKMVSVRMTSYSETQDGFVLMGTFRSEDPRLTLLPFIPLQNIHITDSAGEEIPFEFAPGAAWSSPGETPPQETGWAYEIRGKSFQGPLILTIDAMEVGLNTPVEFEMDLGADPQPDQTWDLNRDLTLLDFPMKLLSARYVVQPDYENRLMGGVEFMVNSAPEIDGVTIDPADPPQNRNGGRYIGVDDRGGKESYPVGFVDYPPMTGIVRFRIARFLMRGNWTVTWNPPVIEGAPSATPVPQACLTESIWDALRLGPVPPLPAGLSGRILTTRGSAVNDVQVLLSGLDGMDTREVHAGFGGALSPDGKRAVVIDPEARLLLTIVDTGETVLLDGGPGNFQPAWSPDGNWIAYVGQEDGVQHALLIHPDGTGRRVLGPDLQVWGVNGWTKDSMKVMVMALAESDPQAPGSDLALVDIADGSVARVLPGVWVNNAALSPDGEWVLYETREFGRRTNWMYLSRLDGSERRLIVAMDEPWMVSNPAWSPDGAWLAVHLQQDMTDPGSNALIRLRTCEVIRLDGIQDAFLSWIP